MRDVGRRGERGRAAAWVGRAGRADWARAREGGGRMLGQRKGLDWAEVGLGCWVYLEFGFGPFPLLSNFYFLFLSNSYTQNSN